MASDDDKTEAKGRAKHRSPNYPLFDLEKAVERAKSLYEKDKMHKVPIGTVHERWGYKKHSAAGNQAVAAVKSYGLATVEGEGENRKVAVSDAGRRIVLDAPDRAELLKTAALGPSLFRSLWEAYREEGLPSDEVLEHHLVFERNFNEDFVGNAIARFKGTVAFAKLVAGDKIEGSAGDSEDDDGGEEEQPRPPAPRSSGIAPKERRLMSGTKEDVYSLDDGAVIVQWPERINGATAADLENWLGIITRKIKRAVESGATEPKTDADSN